MLFYNTTYVTEGYITRLVIRRSYYMKSANLSRFSFLGSTTLRRRSLQRLTFTLAKFRSSPVRKAPKKYKQGQQGGPFSSPIPYDFQGRLLQLLNFGGHTPPWLILKEVKSAHCLGLEVDSSTFFRHHPQKNP